MPFHTDIIKKILYLQGKRGNFHAVIEQIVTLTSIFLTKT